MHFDDAGYFKEICDAFGIGCSVHEAASEVMEQAEEDYTPSPFGSIEMNSYHIMVLDRRFAYAQAAQKFVDVLVDDIRKQNEEKRKEGKKKEKKSTKKKKKED